MTDMNFDYLTLAKECEELRKKLHTANELREWAQNQLKVAVKEIDSIRPLKAKHDVAVAFCQRHAGHAKMQIAQPFRQLINILTK